MTCDVGEAGQARTTTDRDKSRAIAHLSQRSQRHERNMPASPSRDHTTRSSLVAGDAIGEFAEDIEVAVVPGGLLDQVSDDVPQRDRLAGIAVLGY